MNAQDQKTRESMEKICRDIGQLIGSAMPEGWGFSLLVFEFGGPGGNASYISNARRVDMIKALREQADRLERHEDIRPFSQN
jgi:hypothetical protein